MATKTRTGTISTGISSVAAKLSTLFGSTLASKYNNYDDVIMVNTGDVAISVASMEGDVAAAAADFKDIPVGGELPFRRISSKDFWVKATGGTPSFDFIGTPSVD